MQTPLRSALGVVATLALLATAASAPAAPVARATTARAALPAIIGAQPRVRQMITVTSRGFASTTATLKAWHRARDGHWVLARGPVPVVIGYAGWAVAEDRRQDTGTTPAGRFRIAAAFGRLADPGARLRYQQVDGNDWWPYEPRDPATYNIYQRHRASQTRWRLTFAEHLDNYAGEYGYAVEVGFNLPGGVHYSRLRHQWVAARPADTRLGGGIFLHVRGNGLTAGCVAMARREMRWLLRWITPSAEPRIVMGPRHYIIGL